VKNGAASSTDELFAHTRERLTRYKLPASITISPALPKTGVGKIDKVALRAASSPANR
jgi:acyl-CoA synthetase (AMP-forming)/AMP-acid ligase II